MPELALSGELRRGQAFSVRHKQGAKSARLLHVVFDLAGEKVNKFSAAVMSEFEGLIVELDRTAKSGQIDAIILSSAKPGNFIAGADINLIQSAKSASEAEELSRKGQHLFNRWEDLSVPTVVAISGACLGGGLELSLASTAMLVSTDPSTKLGFPEVLLGFIPGLGGCIRAPAKLGIATALDLILTGKTLNGERAFKAGLADGLIQKEGFLDGVETWVSLNIAALKKKKRLAKVPKLGGSGGLLGRILEKTSFGRSFILKQARKGVLSKTLGNYPAPLEAIQVIKATKGAYCKRLGGAARDRALAREALGFGKMATSDVSRNLVKIFFQTEGIKKANGLSSGKSATPAPVKKITASAVLGAGVMGGGVAQLFADKRMGIRMKDLNLQALTLGMQSAIRIFKRLVQTKRMTQREFLQKINLITPVSDYQAFGKLDFVVEAIVEKMEVKKKVFQELESHVGSETVIASNTSSLSISEMQTVFKNPERFGGMHFFNPVHRMPLVEVIRGAKTSDATVATLFQLCKDLGKTPIVVKDAAGFLVNRLLVPYMNEAAYLLAEGVPIQVIDAALVKFGMPMGPIELVDEVGTDVGAKVLHVLHEAFGDRMQPCPIIEKVVGKGRMGKKSGKGMYSYIGEKRVKRLDSEIYKIIGVTPKAISVSAEVIVERCILPMINEASRCLEEGVVATSEDVDLGMIMGTGFPPFRGGLLRYADSLGVRRLVTRLKSYEPELGIRFRPSPALVERSNRDARFYP